MQDTVPFRLYTGNVRSPRHFRADAVTPFKVGYCSGLQKYCNAHAEIASYPGVECPGNKSSANALYL